MTSLIRTLAAGLLALLCAWLGVLPAQAASESAPITRYEVDVVLAPEGVAEVTIDFTMDFTEVEGRGPYLTLLTRQDSADPDYQFAYEYSDIEVSSATGARTDLNEEHSDGVLLLRIGDEHTWNHEPQDYRVTYQASGLIASNHSESGLDEFNWNVIGSTWDSEIANPSVVITGPADVSEAFCFFGPFDDQTPCQAEASGATASYQVDETLAPGNPVQVVASFPAGTFGGVEQELVLADNLRNKFRLTPATGAVAAALLLGGAAAVASARKGNRDEVFLDLPLGLVPADGQSARVGPRTTKHPVTVQFHPRRGSAPRNSAAC